MNNKNFFEIMHRTPEPHSILEYLLTNWINNLQIMQLKFIG